MIILSIYLLTDSFNQTETRDNNQEKVIGQEVLKIPLIKNVELKRSNKPLGYVVMKNKELL